MPCRFWLTKESQAPFAEHETLKSNTFVIRLKIHRDETSRAGSKPLPDTHI